MPSFRFNKAFGVVRSTKVFLDLVKLRKRIKDQKREISQLKEEPRATNKQERLKQKRRLKNKKQEIFLLKNELRDAQKHVKGALNNRPAPQVADGPLTEALPDFVIIGAQKCGTTFFYNLLTSHPHVQRAASKELHFFNKFFNEGIEWYRQCFPAPKWKDERKTITGEATPAYIMNSRAPQRMAEVIPQARLIALLRNPVDRAYSHYQKAVRNGVEIRTFEEAIKAEEAMLRGEENKMFEDEHYNSFGHSYLARGIYVDQLLRWSRFFSDEQMLVLKSEDFFERPQETLNLVLDFLDLPDWEPEASKLRGKRNKGKYEQKMNPATKRRLEGYFEPHNKRLYEYLGMDFGW